MAAVIYPSEMRSSPRRPWVLIPWRERKPDRGDSEVEAVTSPLSNIWQSFMTKRGDGAPTAPICLLPSGLRMRSAKAIQARYLTLRC